MVNKVLGGGTIDGQLGVNPDWINIEAEFNRQLWSIDEQGRLVGWIVETSQAPNGNLLANGLYANPAGVTSDANVDNAQIEANSEAIKALLIAQGLSGNYGSFADGFAYGEVGDVGIDVDGKIYTYAGSDPLPVNVAPETDPVGDSDYQVFKDNAFKASYNVDNNDDIALLDLSEYSVLTSGGDVSNNSNRTTFYRRKDFDNQSNAGNPPALLGGTLFVYDSVGSAFIEVKDAISNRSRSEGRISGRNVHIYQWGSAYSGNDWCFVRTPDNYSIYGKPHPIVILNHGNGWVMDGTPQKANFSDKTQFGVDTQNGGTYLDTNRPDYVQYSNPLIEKFLSEGYVVCGAQNDGANYGGGSAGYGNRETTQNIKSFYEHMKSNYNVEHQVNFVAASNGSIATLNATRIMTKDSVRSITLLYPLINLHYAWANSYTAQVAEAYRFTSNNDFANFRSNTAGFDPMIACCEYGILLNTSDENEYANADYYRVGQSDSTKDVQFTRTDTLINSGGGNVGLGIDNVRFYRRCLFDYPRIRCHWSPSDTITPADAHWTAFRKLVSRGSLTTTFEEQVTGQHGDYTHFEGLDGDGETRIVNWTKI